MRLFSRMLMCLPLFCSSAWAVDAVIPPVQPTTTATQAVAANPAAATTQNANAITQTSSTAQQSKPLTAEQLAKQKAAAEANVRALVKDQANRLQQLEKANLEALSQNQELQLKNDSLGVQVQVLQSERSAQMFLYGAVTIVVGIFIGFLIVSYIYTKRRRQW